MIPRPGTPEEVQWMKENWGWSDEQIKNLTPAQWRNVRATPERRATRLVAEVVKVENCGAKAKIGDRVVFTGAGVMVRKETTFPYLCLFALAPLLPYVYVVYDRCAEGLDPTPQGWTPHVRCADAGVGCGGWGQVTFRVYCEKPR